MTDQTDTAAPPPLSAADIASGADLSRLNDARLLRALDWWNAKRPDPQTLPDRAALDPLDIPDLLPHLVLWSVIWPPPTGGSFDFRCRLAGTHMVDIHGREFTGQRMETFHGRQNAQIQPEYEFVARTGQPHWVERSLFWMNRDYQRYRRILLPFTHVAMARSPAEAMRPMLILNVSTFHSD